jgi:hypothetical protein
MTDVTRILSAIDQGDPSTAAAAELKVTPSDVIVLQNVLASGRQRSGGRPSR